MRFPPALAALIVIVASVAANPILETRCKLATQPRCPHLLKSPILCIHAGPPEDMLVLTERCQIERDIQPTDTSQ